MTVVALSMGDPAGIGPELIWACWRALGARNDLRLLAVADPAVLRAAGDGPMALVEDPRDVDGRSALAVYWPHAPARAVSPGAPDPATAPATIAAIETAAALVRGGAADAVCTMPIAKSVLQAAGFGFPGHTEFLAHLTADLAMHPDRDGPRGPVMMLSAPALKVALATIHTPLARVAAQLSAERITHVGQIVAHALARDFGRPHPRLALCGLNPHAGEDGAIGREDIDVINPAAAALRARGVDCTNALPADSLFHDEARARYDAAIAMYHDQGLIPIKTLAFWSAVNVTLGLPIVRTSPDHGTGFDIAGRARARPDSAIAAVNLAVAMVNNRRAFDAAL